MGAGHGLDLDLGDGHSGVGMCESSTSCSLRIRVFYWKKRSLFIQQASMEHPLEPTVATH